MYRVSGNPWDWKTVLRQCVSSTIITMHESGLANTRETTCSEFHCKELNSAPKCGFSAFFNVVLFIKGKIEAPRRPQ